MRISTDGGVQPSHLASAAPDYNSGMTSNMIGGRWRLIYWLEEMSNGANSVVR